MAVDDEARISVAIRAKDLIVRGIWHGRPPQVVDSSVDKQSLILTPCPRELANPRKALLTEPLSRPRSQRLKQGFQPAPNIGCPTLLLRLTRGIEKNLIGVAEDSRPSQVANTIDDFRRPRTDDSKIPAWHDQIGCIRVEVGDDRFQCDQVAVDIRHDRQPLRHGRCTEPSSPNFQSGLWATSQTEPSRSANAPE